jgi:hypothetical protein
MASSEIAYVYKYPLIGTKTRARIKLPRFQPHIGPLAFDAMHGTGLCSLFVRRTSPIPAPPFYPFLVSPCASMLRFKIGGPIGHRDKARMNSENGPWIATTKLCIENTLNMCLQDMPTSKASSSDECKLLLQPSRVCVLKIYVCLNAKTPKYKPIQKERGTAHCPPIFLPY